MFRFREIKTYERNLTNNTQSYCGSYDPDKLVEIDFDKLIEPKKESYDPDKRIAIDW